MADIYTEPEPLPLLEFALTRLWQWEQTNRKEQLTLSHLAYEEIGGVAGALTQHAQDVLEQLPDKEQQEVRNVLLQLIRPGQNTVDTRRIASKDEITEAQWGLITYLADNRLVVTSSEAQGEETAQIIHEALLRSWPQLQSRINENRSFRVWQERLRQTIMQWEKLGRDPSGLISGAILGEAEEWLTKQPEHLTAAEHQYLQQCINKRDAQLAAEEAERQTKLRQAEALAEAEHRQVQIEQKNNSRLRRLISILAIFFVIVLTAGAIAYQQSQRAQTLANLSQSLNLASSAQLALLEGNSGLALALL